MPTRTVAQGRRDLDAVRMRRSLPARGAGLRWPLVRDGLAVMAIVLGILFGIAIYLPAEGRLAGPLRDGLSFLLGRATFILPLALLVGGSAVLVRSFVPDAPLPIPRLTGAALIAVATFPSLHLIGLEPGGSLARVRAHEGGGLVGHWLGTGLLEALGGPGTAVLLSASILVGALLLLDLTVAQVVSAVLSVARWCRLRLVGRGLVRARAEPQSASSVPLVAPRSRIPSMRVSRMRFALPWLRPVRRSMRARFGMPRLFRAQDRPMAAISQTLAPSHTQGREDAGQPPAQGSVTQEHGGVEGPSALFASPHPPLSASPSPRPPLAASLALHDSTSPAMEWRPPLLDVFQARTVTEMSASDLTARSRIIEETLASFNIEARVVEANQGPAVTQFGIEPAPGIAVSRILSRQNDLALRLGSSPIRLEAPVPGKSMVGVEVPNTAVATVTIRDAIESQEWERGKGKLRLALGRDVSGKAIIGDLGRMPHLLIAGATGAGKSVCINTIVGSLLYQFTPDELQLLMIDPKRVELVGFTDIPHLRLPVVTDMDKVVGALKWVVLEMDRRYKLFAQHGVRNLEGYNRRARDAGRPDEAPLPFLVVVIDELADMMMTAAEEVEKTLCRLAQLARATGIHLVVATQRPSVDVLTGLIKANFPTRIAFAVSSQTDSRVILDQAGAEKLLGRGDALYMPTDAMKPVRLQGAYVSDEEMQALVAHWKAQGGPRYTAEEIERIEALGRGEEEDDEIYDRAVELAETGSRLSVSLLQRRLGIGQARAQRLYERLADEGYAEG